MKSTLNKISNSLRKAVLLAILFLSAAQVKAQYEPHFTQYMFNEMFINPAYAGARECISATGLYRKQWVGIDGAPVTETVSIHSPFFDNKMGIGLAVVNEKIGVTQNTGFNASYAYRMPLSKGKLSLGLQIGAVNHYEELSKLTTVQSGDAQFANNTPKLLLPNAGFGAFYYTQKFYAGLSIPHLILNTVDAASIKKVTNKASVKDWHYYITAGYIAKVSDNIKLKPTIMIKEVVGSPMQFDASLNALFVDVFWVGAAYRTGDAVSAIAGIQITKQLRLGYAYDYTLSKLKKYNTGTHEITLGFDFSFDKSKIANPRFF